MRRGPLLAGGALLLTAAGLLLRDDDDDEAPGSWSWAGQRVILIGDSHLGSPSFRRELDAALEARGATVVGALQNNGWSVRRYLNSGLLRNLPGRPTAAVVTLGGNNHEFQAAVYQSEVEAFVSELRRQGIQHIAWAGPATSNPRIAANTARRHESTAELQRVTMPALGVDWWDSRRSTQTGQRSDGVHFDGSGYTRWARDFASALG